MNDTRELMRRGLEGFEPMPDAFERVLVRRDRKRRNRRVAAGIVGIVVFLIAAAGFVRLLGSERTTPADPEPAPPRAGWMVFSAAHIEPVPEARYPNRGTNFELYVGAPDGSARLLVGTEGDKATLGCPVFSPNGSLLAYGKTWQRQGAIGALMEVVVTGFTSSGELRGGDDTFTVPSSTHILAPCPAWAPDGRRLATIAPDDGVMFINLSGFRTLVRISAPNLADGVKGIEWSPDGSRVAVLLWPTRPNQALWIVPAFGGVARSVSGFGEGYRIETVAWAPDGLSVVVGGSSGPPSEALPFVKLVDLATGDASDVPLPGSWDGSTIMRVLPIGDDRFLVERAATGWHTPELLDLQGNVTPLGAEYPVASFISLSPDGTHVLYVALDPTHTSPGMAVVAVPLDGGEPTRYSPWSKGFGDNYATFTWRPR